MCAKKRVNTGEVEQFGWLDMKKKRVRGEGIAEETLIMEFVR